MTDLAHNQLDIPYLNKNQNYVRSISAGNGVTVTDDGAGNYVINLGATLELFNNTDWLPSSNNSPGLDETPIWVSPTALRFPPQFGKSVTFAAPINTYDGVEFADSGGLPGSAGNVIRFSGTYVPTGFDDQEVRVLLADGSVAESSVSTVLDSTTGTWVVLIDLTQFSQNLWKYSFFHNFFAIDFTIDKVEIL